MVSGAEALFRYVLECGPPGLFGHRVQRALVGLAGRETHRVPEVIGALSWARVTASPLGPCTPAPIVYPWSGERTVVIAVGQRDAWFAARGRDRYPTVIVTALAEISY